MTVALQIPSLAVEGTSGEDPINVCAELGNVPSGGSEVDVLVDLSITSATAIEGSKWH